MGSSTATIVVLKDKTLEALNLGDSGFLLLRRQEGGYQIVLRSKEQQHHFNMPFQLGTDSSDRPEHAERVEVPVEVGDVVLLATDGVWDNMFEDEIKNMVEEIDVPQEVANRLAEKAIRIGRSEGQPTPFSMRAEEQGLFHPGGKLDDVTVVVAYVSE
mmetsp:Transcript_48048/g.75028  ORF Transcript_48048/g.75028 Transcript_48048/m.75028 type:complete len:158 (-) Transcript_48048:69-542(-)